MDFLLYLVIIYIFNNFCSDVDIFASNKYLEKKLSTLARSVYLISRLLPCFNLQRDNENALYFKVFKSKRGVGEFNRKFDMKKIKMHNTKLGWKLDIKYASSKDVLSKFEVGRGGQGEMGLQEDDENDFDFYVYPHRQRFFSESFRKKVNPSYEILNFSTEDPVKMNDNYFSCNNTNSHSNSGKRKLSVQVNKDDILHLLSKEEIEGLGPFDRENNNEIEIKISDSSSPSNSHSDSSNNSFQLNIEDDKGSNKVLTELDGSSFVNYQELKSQFINLKHKLKNSKNKINVYKLMKIVSNK